MFRKLRAKLFGYFWLPCPICGEYYSGAEVKGWEHGIPTRKPGIYQGVCKKCQYEAGMLTVLYKHGLPLGSMITPKAYHYMARHKEDYTPWQD